MRDGSRGRAGFFLSGKNRFWDAGDGGFTMLMGDFAKFAEACGGVGMTARDPSERKPALERALHCGKATIVEVYVDPNEPPLPGYVKPRQALKFAEASLKGQPQGAEYVIHGAEPLRPGARAIATGSPSHMRLRHAPCR